jgi:hypothetical protein
VLLAPETVEVREHPRFAPQALAVPPEVRGTFVVTLLLPRLSPHAALVGGATAVVTSGCLLILALEAESLAVMFVCGVTCGIGQSLAVGAGLAAIALGLAGWVSLVSRERVARP